MFSDKKLAQFINNNFEACWQTLRAVPILTVDFGDGRHLKRTLHGNIASYICLPDGQVVDVLPGIYGPRSYEKSLATLLSVSSYVTKATDRASALVSYHQGKTAYPLHEVAPTAEPEILALGDIRFAQSIRRDITDNECTRRPIIHKMLGQRREAHPKEITNDVYKRTLNLDLADPYLGLGEAMTCTFPGESAK